MGARRERRRTMMGDSYFTSVSTGGIGMAPGLLRRKRTARRSLSQSRARVPTQTALGKSERKALAFAFSLECHSAKLSFRSIRREVCLSL